MKYAQVFFCLVSLTHFDGNNTVPVTALNAQMGAHSAIHLGHCGMDYEIMMFDGLIHEIYPITISNKLTSFYATYTDEFLILEYHSAGLGIFHFIGFSAE